MITDQPHPEPGLDSKSEAEHNNPSGVARHPSMNYSVIHLRSVTEKAPNRNGLFSERTT